MKLLSLLPITLCFTSCISTKKVHTEVGFDDLQVMGELPIFVDVRKAKLIGDSLSFETYVHVSDVNPQSVEVQVYKYASDTSYLLGRPENDGIFKIKTSFSNPDTFSFTSPSYRKIYLYFRK